MTQVSERYAEALFSAAVDMGCVDDVSGELQGIKELAEQFSWLFKDPRIVAGEKISLIADALTDKVAPLTLEFLIMILERHHWKHLPGVAESFKRMSDDHFKKVSVFLHVPFKPEQAVLDRMENRFREKGLIPRDAKEITLNTIEDKDIVGGFIAFCNGHQIDASIRTQLTKIRRAER